MLTRNFNDSALFAEVSLSVMHVSGRLHQHVHMICSIHVILQLGTCVFCTSVTLSTCYVFANAESFISIRVFVILILTSADYTSSQMLIISNFV